MFENGLNHKVLLTHEKKKNLTDSISLVRICVFLDS